MDRNSDRMKRGDTQKETERGEKRKFPKDRAVPGHYDNQ